MTPEGIVKEQVKDYLNLKQIFHFHLLQGLGCFKGVPDRIAVMKTGEVLFIEIKSKKGTQSDYQKMFELNITDNNNIYILARKVEDIVNIVEKIEAEHG